MKNKCVLVCVYTQVMFLGDHFHSFGSVSGSNILDLLVTNPSWWLTDSPSASLNLLLINLSSCITLNIRSSWRGTGGICLCIPGGQLLLEKPTRFISVTKRCVSSFKGSLGKERTKRYRTESEGVITGLHWPLKLKPVLIGSNIQFNNDVHKITVVLNDAHNISGLLSGMLFSLDYKKKPDKNWHLFPG